MRTSTEVEDAEPIVVSTTTSQASLESLDVVHRSLATDDEEDIDVNNANASVCTVIIHHHCH